MNIPKTDIFGFTLGAHFSPLDRASCGTYGKGVWLKVRGDGGVAQLSDCNHPTLFDLQVKVPPPSHVAIICTEDFNNRLSLEEMMGRLIFALRR